MEVVCRIFTCNNTSLVGMCTALELRPVAHFLELQRIMCYGVHSFYHHSGTKKREVLSRLGCLGYQIGNTTLPAISQVSNIFYLQFCKTEFHFMTIFSITLPNLRNDCNWSIMGNNRAVFISFCFTESLLQFIVQSKFGRNFHHSAHIPSNLLFCCQSVCMLKVFLF